MVEFGRSKGIVKEYGGLTPDNIIGSELADDEKLIWADRPISTRHHAISQLPGALFGIPFFAFSVFWTWGAAGGLRENGLEDGAGLFHLFFPLFGIPFMAVGAGMLLSPLWAVWKAGRTVYAVTDRRLIILERRPRYRLRSWTLDKITRFERTGAAGGPGNVYFAEEVATDSDGDRSSKKIGFLGINDPKRLEDTISGLIGKAAKS